MVFTPSMRACAFFLLARPDRDFPRAPNCYTAYLESEISMEPMIMFLLNDCAYVGQNGAVATNMLRSTYGGQCDQEVSVFTLKEPY